MSVYFKCPDASFYPRLHQEALKESFHCLHILFTSSSSSISRVSVDRVILLKRMRVCTLLVPLLVIVLRHSIISYGMSLKSLSVLSFKRQRR